MFISYVSEGNLPAESKYKAVHDREGVLGVCSGASGQINRETSSVGEASTHANLVLIHSYYRYIYSGAEKVDDPGQIQLLLPVWGPHRLIEATEAPSRVST